MILGSLAALFTLGMLGWSIFAPPLAAWSFVSVIFAMDLVLFGMDRSARHPPDRLGLTRTEEPIFRRHGLAILTPGGAAEMCAALQVTRWSAIAWVPWLLYSGESYPAAGIASHFVVTSSLSVRMNPVGPYLQAAKNGNLDFGLQAAIIKSLIERMHGDDARDGPA